MPLRLLAFDLDGTLIETERLKARSYALAANDLNGSDVDIVEAAYTGVVGRSRQEVGEALADRFGIAGAGGEAPWETLVRVRLGRYEALLADDTMVRGAALPEADALVRHAHAVACRVALITTSDRAATDRVLAVLGLADAFDAIVTADDVAQTKPDPEGYRLALAQTRTDPAEALSVEDSAAGVQAALAAGVRVVAVPTAITRTGLAEAGLLEAGAGGGRVTVAERGELVEAVREALGRA